MTALLGVCGVDIRALHMTDSYWDIADEKRRPDFAAKRALAVLQPMMLRRKKDVSFF